MHAEYRNHQLVHSSRNSVSQRIINTFARAVGIATITGLLATAAFAQTAQPQVFSGVRLDAGAARAVIVRSPSNQLQAGRLVNNVFQFTNLTDPGANYRIVAATDLDNNGRDDLVIQDITQGEFGDVFVWPGFSQANQFFLRKVKRVWDVQAVGNLDGDEFGDLVWRYTVVNSPDTGVSYIWFTNGTSVTQVRKRGGAPVSWTLLGAADLNGDGAVDMVYVDPNNNIRVLMATPNRTCANLSGQALPPGYKALKLAKFTNFFSANSYGVLSRNQTTGAVAISYLDAAGLTLPPYAGAPDDQNASCTASSLVVKNTVISLPATDPTWQFYASGDFNGDGITDIAWVRPDGTLTVWLVQVGATVAPIVINNAGAAPFYVPPLPLGAPTITSATPPSSGTVGTVYTYNYIATGGSAATTWSVTVGALPAGITLNSATGVLTGIPTTVGVFSFTVQAANGTLPNATQAATITIAAAGPSVSGDCLNGYDFTTGNTYVYRSTTAANGTNGASVSEQQQKVIGPGMFQGKAVTIVEYRNYLNGALDPSTYTNFYYDDKGSTVGVVAAETFNTTGKTTTTYLPVDYFPKVLTVGANFNGNYTASTVSNQGGLSATAQTIVNYTGSVVGTEDVNVPAGAFKSACKSIFSNVTTRSTFAISGFPVSVGGFDFTCTVTNQIGYAGAIGSVKSSGPAGICTGTGAGGLVPSSGAAVSELIRATVNGKSYP